jgi:uncharacterized protein (DUF2384 family)
MSLLTDIIVADRIDPDRMAGLVQTTKSELARSLGVSRESLSRRDRVAARATQARMRQVTEILNRVEPWAGSPLAAYAWYRAQGLPGFGDRTARQLVQEGLGEAVLDYLDEIAGGGYA